MPEVITRHPDVVKQVLESAGAKCGTGAPQKILTKCPREQFCALPGGEICVFPVSGIPQMTQLSRSDICQARTEGATPGGSGIGALAADWSAAALLPAVVVAALLRRPPRARPPNGGA